MKSGSIPMSQTVTSCIYLLFFPLFLSGCDSSAAPEMTPPPPEVGVASVRAEAMPQIDEFTGRIEASEVVHLRPRVSGYIVRVNYTEGEDVAKGEVLFEIDARSYQAALDQAEAREAQAEARYELRQSELVRAEQLLASRTMAVELVEQRRAAAQEAKAELRAARAAVDLARLDLEYTRVRAPAAGRAGRAAVTAGNLATADVTLLTSINKLDPVHVYFEADEQRLLRYHRERGGDGVHDANRVQVALSGDNGFPYSGQLDFMDHHLDPRTGTLQVRAVLANPDGRLTPGLFARVRLFGNAAVERLLIDDLAILTDQDRKFVYVVDDQGLAQRRDITIGRAIDGQRIVESGLEAGEAVIVEGTQRVHFPGMPVQASPLDRSPVDDLTLASGPEDRQ
jgi:membrane fusion protein, multidrug efflux system